MAATEHLKRLKKGVKFWNKSKMAFYKADPIAELIGAELSRADLRGVNLSSIDLSGDLLAEANLAMADLSQADLNGAYLGRCDLSGANLRGADLGGADLTEANLMGADLTGANLKRAKLVGATLCKVDAMGANFDGADVTDADFTGAILVFTTFTNLDLSSAKGLDSVSHRGPCSIGIDTFYESRGNIPAEFLRGCGVPDSFIGQAKALVGAEEGIQFYSCFISYSSKDEEFARRLHERLQRDHVRVWFAPEDLAGGKKLHEQIDEAIRVYDKLLILLSHDSLQSEWVMTELRKARKSERKSGRRKIFPLGLVTYATLEDWECFDADGGKDLAVEVREYYIPDFTQWKHHDVFEANYARLLNDLRAIHKAMP